MINDDKRKLDEYINATEKRVARWSFAKQEAWKEKYPDFEIDYSKCPSCQRPFETDSNKG